jgi:hypothetical protein
VRAYTVAATALTLGVPLKWLDNVLSHYRVDGVVQSRQGVTRRVTPPALQRLKIALNLHRVLGAPIKRSLELADQLVEARGKPVVPVDGSFIQLSAMLDDLNDSLTSDLAHALEVAPTPKRGRPQHKKKAGRF